LEKQFAAYRDISKTVRTEKKEEVRFGSRTSVDDGSPGIIGCNIGSPAAVFEEVFGWRAPE
jgi:hypothetical protein